MTSPSESLLRSALLKDELASRRRRIPEPIIVKRLYEEDGEEDEVITPSSLSARAPSPSFGWLWREECEEEDDAVPPRSRDRPKTPTPRVRSRTTPSPSRSALRTRSTSADGSVPLSFGPPLTRHAWSADSVPKSQLARRREPEPETPRTPSRTFCALSASQTIKDVPGLVSFGDVEGLGMPEESDAEAEEDKESWTKKWLHWRS